MIVSGGPVVYGTGGSAGLTRNVTGMLANEAFTSLSGWTAGAHFSADTTKPLYAVYRSTQTLLAHTTGEASTLRDCALMCGASGASPWYMLYDSAPTLGDTWTAHLAKSTDKGRSWTRLGSITSFNHGSPSTWSMSATMHKGGDGYIYTFVLNCGSLSGGIPSVPYTTQTYRIAEADIADVTKWTWVIDTPALGGGGSIDSVQSTLATARLIAGTWHGWITQTGSSAPVYTTGHGTFASGLTGAFTKDGVADDAAAINNNSTGSYPENPKIWFSTVLNKWIKASNAIDFAQTHAEANDIYLADTYNGFSGASSYRVRVQHEYEDANSGYVGLPQAYCDGDMNAIEETDGSVGWLYDGDNTGGGTHQLRDALQAQAVCSTGALKFTAPTPGTAGVEYAVKTLSHTDIVIEIPLSFLQTDAGTSDLCVLYRQDGATSDATCNGYMVRFSSQAAQAVSLYKIVAGVQTLIVSSSAQTLRVDKDSRNLQMNKMRIECIGTSHKVYWGATFINKLIDTTDATFASGTSIAFRGTGSVSRVFGCRAYKSKTVTVNACGAGSEVILRGASGAIFDVQTASAGGVATLTSDHFPMYSLSVAGTQLTPLDGGRIWGGDTLTVA